MTQREQHLHLALNITRLIGIGHLFGMKSILDPAAGKYNPQGREWIEAKISDMLQKFNSSDLSVFKSLEDEISALAAEIKSYIATGSPFPVTAAFANSVVSTLKIRERVLSGALSATPAMIAETPELTTADIILAMVQDSDTAATTADKFKYVHHEMENMYSNRIIFLPYWKFILLGSIPEILKEFCAATGYHEEDLTVDTSSAVDASSKISPAALTAEILAHSQNSNIYPFDHEQKSRYYGVSIWDYVPILPPVYVRLAPGAAAIIPSPEDIPDHTYDSAVRARKCSAAEPITGNSWNDEDEEDSGIDEADFGF